MLKTPARSPTERTSSFPATIAATAEFESTETVSTSIPSCAKNPSSSAIIIGA